MFPGTNDLQTLQNTLLKVTHTLAFLIWVSEPDFNFLHSSQAVSAIYTFETHSPTYSGGSATLRESCLITQACLFGRKAPRPLKGFPHNSRLYLKDF